MERKKIIFIIGLITLVVFVISGSLMIYKTLYEIKLGKNESALRQDRMAKAKDYYQQYLDRMARKITVLPVNPNLINEIQSTLYNKESQVMCYLWLSDKTGGLVFGIPSHVFTRLNKNYEKEKARIEKADYYSDKNDYIINNLSDNSSGWHFHYRHFLGSWETFEPVLLSAAVVGSDGQMIGDLYIKFYDAYPGAEYDQVLYQSVFPTAQVLLIFSGIFLWFLLPSWVYIDARQRDMKRAFMWALVTVISLIFGLVIYLITRPSGYKTFHCPNCHGELNGTKAFCPHCGMDLSSAFCPQCQYPIKAEWEYCPACRFDIHQKEIHEIENTGEQLLPAEREEREENE